MAGRDTLNFVLQGRDALSRALDSAGDAAERLRRRLNDSANDSSRALAGFTRDADGRLRDLRGRFVSAEEAARRLREGLADLPSPFAEASDKARILGERLRGSLISLAPAAIPAAAGLAGAALQVSAQLGAAAVAAGAYSAALAPQVVAIKAVTDAQTKYQDAVTTSGKTSQETAQAQLAVQQQLAALPPATQRAAVAVGLLRDNFKGWSDSLSGDVMGPFTKGVGIANALLPRTTTLAKGASVQVDRLVTMLGGAVQTPGFDRAADKLNAFAEKSLRGAVDEVGRFFARLDAGKVGGGLQQFLDYCRQNGPVVGETLRHVGDALLNVLQAGSDVGVGMLQVINALSGVVAAVPPDAIATLLQLAVAIKAVRLAAVGGSAAKAALAGIATQIAAMRAASVAAPGAISSVTAAIGGLSRGVKVAVAGTGIGLLLIALGELSQHSRKAPPDVDKLTTSLASFAKTGKASGEAARAFGSNLDDLYGKVRSLTDPSTVDQVQQFLVGWTGWDSTPVKDAKENIDAIDKSLAQLVSQGKADLAAEALKKLTAEYGKGGRDTKEFTKQLNDYQDALQGQALEQRLAAESMGLFGDQAQRVQTKLDAQKKSADGLRQSIQALNDVNRSALGGQIGFEAAIDAAGKAARDNAGALKMHNGQLVLNSEKSRNAASALNDLAGKTDEAAAAARDSGASWSRVNGIYERGRQKLVETAQQMGLTRAQAKRLADQILSTPDKTAKLKGDIADLKAKISDAKKRLANAPSSKTAHIRGEIADLERKLRTAQAKLAAIKSKTVTITAQMIYTGPKHGPYASGYEFGRASGGPVLRRAAGGSLPGFPGGGMLYGPGTETSDSIPLFASAGEYVVKASSVRKYGLKFMDSLNAGKLPVGRSAPAAGRPAAVVQHAGGAGQSQPPVTYNVYPRASVISVEDLRLIQRQEEARQRVGRAR
ncbi:hypothetical protein [Streptomyces odontomachi]|uniref:hypothetical protein n=1 Tax=Streptomyces odontomachi TaxID=2944940 RepID=UPI0021096F5E|nr:hypothetical protein [Streptomyces sp. ODS25]